MKLKFKNRKKILIIASLIAIILIGAIVSIVVVFAANIQSTETNVKLTYVVNGVGAKVSANYAVLPNDESQLVSTTAMTTADSNETIEFKPSGGTQTASLEPAGDLILTTKKQRAVIEYIFENTANSAFSISLTNKPTGVNMTEKYYVTGTRLNTNEYIDAVTSTETVAPQAMTYYGQKCYIYIMIEVTNEARQASYEGEFKWVLENQETTNVKLSCDGEETIFPIISTSKVSGIAMPVLNSKPNIGLGMTYMGYYTEPEGAGIQYIKANGGSNHEADLTANSILYAYVNGLYMVEDTAITGLTNKGKEATKLVIPSNITSIGENAFSNSIAETIIYEGAEGSVEYSDGEISLLKIISSNAFANCENLKVLRLPNTVNTIGTTILSGCNNLEELEMPHIINNGSSTTVSGLSRLFGTSNENISINLKKLKFSNYNQTKTVPNYFLAGCTSLESVELPTNIEQINSYAFYNCINLKSVNLTDKLNAIASCAFYNCEGLESIYLGNNIEYIHSQSFYNCKSLTSIEMKDNAISLVSGAFKGCSNLKYVRLSKQMVSLPDETFSGCSSITYIENTQNLKGLGSQVFSGCSSLLELELPLVTTYNYGIFEGCSSLKRVVINDGLTTLKDSLFDEVVSLEIVNMPVSLISIPPKLFYNCQSLKSLVIPASVTTIGNSAFRKCSQLESIEFLNDNTLTSLGMYVFAECSSLKNINLPNSIPTIDYQCFYKCSSLENITIPQSTKTIGYAAFSNCSNLKNIQFHENGLLTSIGSSSFVSIAISHLVLPEGLTTIQNSAFSYCLSLTEVTLPTTLTTINNEAFYQSSAITKTHIKSLESYLGINVPNGRTLPSTVSRNLYLNGVQLNEITIPASVTKISRYVFYKINTITKITFEDTYGWFYASSDTAESGADIDVTNPNVNAENLSYTRGSYYTQDWTEYYLLKKDSL